MMGQHPKPADDSLTHSVELPNTVAVPESFWNEFRAVYSRPSIFLDTPEDRERGFVIERTDWFKSPVEARQKVERTSAETLAIYQGMEMTWVSRSKPESVSP